MQMQVGKMLIKLEKWQVYQMASWQIVKLTNYNVKTVLNRSESGNNSVALSTASNFQPRLMFVGKSGRYLRGAN